ncbi:MAG: LCP family protein [Clostridia bacterium]|nr:LCP family protein [Clostridia bacterium]
MIYDDQNKLIPKKQKGIKKILTQVVEGIKNVAVFIGRGIKEISIRIKGMNKWAKIIISLVVIIMILTAILVSKFVGDRLSKIHFKDLDEGNLGINTEVYSEIEGLTKKEYDQVVNILLLGSDSKDMSDQYDGNSDAIMIISINPKFKSIKLISIPRDTAANIAGFENRYKINAAFATGKEQLAVKTINENFGLNIKEYVTVNISSMYDIINEIGGVELEITKEEMNSINHFVDMFYQFSGKPTKKVTSYGKVTLTGEQAAAHVKEREAGYRSGTTDYGDFGRTRRQREVLVAMLNKILTKDLGEISRIIDLILEQVTTNINVGKYMGMLPELVANKDAYLNNLTSVMIPKNEYSEEILENGTFLYVTDLEKAKKDFIHYMYEM